MNNDLKQITEAAAGGDKAAFETLYSSYRDRLFFFAKKYTGSREAAEDIVSETFIAAMEKLPTLRKGEAVGSWLYSIAYNKCMDHLKAQAGTTSLDDSIEQELRSPVMLPDDYAVNEQMKAQLRDIIDSLSPEARSAVILYYYEEMSLEEVARSMHTNENAAKQRLFRARQTIRKEIEKRLGSGAVLSAVPLGAVLNTTAEYAAQSSAAGGAAVGGTAKVAGAGFAAKAAAIGAAAVLAVGVPIGLSKLREGGGYRDESSNAVIESRDDSSQADNSEAGNENSRDDSSYESDTASGRIASRLSIGSEMIDIPDGTNSEIAKAVLELKALDPSDYTVNVSDTDWRLSVITENDDLTFLRCPSDKGWVLMKDKSLYEDSPELNELIMSCVENNVDRSSTRGSWYTIECAEPVTEQEYIDAAVKCCDGWFSSLQSDDTEEYFRNTGYEITVTEESSGHRKCNYLSCGIVNGRKEFVVEICFTAEDCGEGTFYDRFYQEGRYTEAGTFWSGQYICGRFRYEDGKCTLINYGTRDQSAAMQQGLNGINLSKYKTFFDFARRPDMEQALEDSYVYAGSCTVSRNLTQTEDGTPINIDIFANRADSEDDGTYTAIWNKRACINRKPTYATGLYFTDNGTGHMPDTLPKDFKLTFDNYDGDANPDFCCRYDADENGTFYVLDSVQTDGRIFNLSGRAFSGGIYIAGCTDPSPRLQKTDNCQYIGWKLDDDGSFYPTNESGNKITLPEMNMYSDRLYLPDDKKLYSQDENTVTCFLWNNTDSPVTTDTVYSIEMLEGSEWAEVSGGLTGPAVTVQPRDHAEVSFDISSLKDRYNTQYRIVQKCGQYTACGRFWCEGAEVQNVTAENASAFAGGHCGSFEVTSTGYETVEITEAAIIDGTGSYPLSVSMVSGSDGSDSMRYSFIASALPEKAGIYKLILNGSIEAEITVADVNAELQAEVSAKLDGEELVLTVTPSKECSFIDCLGIKKDSGDFMIQFYTDGASDLPAGKTTTLRLKNIYHELMNMDGNMAEELYERYQKNRKDLELYGFEEGLDKDTFLQKLTELFSFNSTNGRSINVVLKSGNKEYSKTITL